MLLANSSTSNSLGLDTAPIDVRVVAQATFLKGQVGELDIRGLQSDNLTLADPDSGWAGVTRPSVQGSLGSGTHVVLLQDLDPGEKGWARKVGRAQMRLSGSPSKSAAVTLNGNSAGQRIRGLVLESTTDAEGLYGVLWDGVYGFGQLVDVSGGGGNDPPIADIQPSPASGDRPLTVTLDASASTDPDGIIVKYEFNFDEGGGFNDNGSTDQIVHIFSYAGTYHPSVRVTDDDGLQDIDTCTVIVTDPTGQDTQPPPDGGESGVGIDAIAIVIR